ncbi:MAG: branched-chain amino acid ABC transporter substrate-binding protein [Alphaproteobacteria bacterium]|nr:branched-chain amino acid ABC transporter substrate-binding protein [Alphaproteobacteria bacterium]
MITRTITLAAAAALAAGLAPAAALAQKADAKTIRLAYIDPLSGPFANTGDLGLKHYVYFADRVNAAGGVNGKKLEIVPFDSKVNPQEALIQLKKAMDSGIRYVFQGNGSNVALAISEAVQKHNERNKGKEVLYVNYAAVDPALTNDKCHAYHFRFDADADMKMAAMVAYMARQQNIKKVYLFNQDYSFGKAVATAARKMLGEKRSDVQIVGDELHPLGRVTDFSPYVQKIKASGADSVITGNWGNDMSLLIKAAKDSGLEVDWYTYYAGALGTPTAIGAAGKNRVKQVTEWHKNVPSVEMEAIVQDYEKRFNPQGATGAYNEYAFLRVMIAVDMLAEAMKKAKSDDPAKVRAALNGLRHRTSFGEVWMRADNQQLIQPLYVSTMVDAGTPQVKYDVEKTGMGFRTDDRIEAKDTEVATTCKLK